MVTPVINSAADDREISLVDLVLIVVRRWIVVALFAAIGVGIALAVAFLTPARYRAETVISPIATDLDESARGGLSGGLGGLASLVGLGGAQGGSIERNIAILKSRALAEHFIRTRNLRPILFAERWDPAKGRWKQPEGWGVTLGGGLASASSRQAADGGPSPDTVYERFEKVREVSLEKTSGLLQLKMTFRDPQIAADWANDFVATANDYIRSRYVAEAARRRQLLAAELQKSSLAAIQQSIFNRTENELRRTMTANVRDQFAFIVVDPATRPELRSWPRRMLILVIGLAVGTASGVLASLTLSGLAESSRARKLRV